MQRLVRNLAIGTFWALVIAAALVAALPSRGAEIAFWDNRATVHYASNDYGDYPRRMERVAIVGDRPFH